MPNKITNKSKNPIPLKKQEETAERSESESEISESSSDSSSESEIEEIVKPVVKTKTVVKKPAVVVEKKKPIVEKENVILPDTPVKLITPAKKAPLTKKKLEQLAKARQARIDKNAMSKAEEAEIIQLQGNLVEAELQKRLTKKIYKAVSTKIRKERLEQLKSATKDIPLSDDEKEQEKPKQKQKESLYAKLLGF